MKLEKLFQQMWDDYIAFNPMAAKIHQLIEKRGEKILNDHIALRTFNQGPIGLQAVAKPFLDLGYKYSGEYEFKEKKLYAQHFEHPDVQQPKIFISELLVEKMSASTQKIIALLLRQLPADFKITHDFFTSGRPWKLTSQDYENLSGESEYASWVAAYGFRPNHFTINVNALKTFPSLQSLNEYLQQNGIVLNASGGIVKGTPAEYLEQSSTMAEKTNVQFEDKTVPVPACYYEFARRYADKDGKLYQGFIAQSADKIFESTNR